MADYPPAPVPERPSLSNLRSAIHACRACDLYANAMDQFVDDLRGVAEWLQLHR